MPDEREAHLPLPEQELYSEDEDADEELFLEAEEDISDSSFSYTSSDSSPPSSPPSSELCSTEEDTPQGPVAENASLSAMIGTPENINISSPGDEVIAAIPQSPPDAAYLPQTPIDEKVAMLVHYLLFKYQTKEVVTKEDMVNAIIKEYEENFSEIILRASERIEMMFGLDVLEVDPVSRCYVLRIKLDITYDGLSSETEGMPKTGLLILVLGVIFMQGNRATEEEIWQALNIMGIYSGMSHFIFGDPRRLIVNDFVHENYLVYHQLPNYDPPCYEFVWGPRAKAEVSKMKLLVFLSGIYGVDPTFFLSQYIEAEKEEEDRGHASASTSSGASSSTATESSYTTF
ncbi:PREDICTED: melanoma-associated antigen B16-like [Elephantulus edwardii]|uniref:melanoma-associated antigen B16-like n=1 Tax=Elephantulus edwardii TaxID=28737 RepID=UPI0003F0ED0D|nr:PREDICTED: melanoma-associated antigen B16-like [Elephantulus edwardii]